MRLRSTIVLSIIAFAGLSSCKSQKEVVEKTKIEKTAMVSTINVPYFKGVGTEPFWSVEVSEKEVKFTVPGDEKGLIFPNDNMDELQEDMKLAFANKTHMITIAPTLGECSDGMSERRFSHKVHVTLVNGETGETKEYYGCAQFFADAKLNAIWMLETLRDQQINQKDFGDAIPYLEIATDKNLVNGFAGCNRISGTLEVNTMNRLKFVNVASTKMMCDPENKEQEFLNLLAKVGAYKFDGDTLILLDPTYVPVATFKKRY